jgi:cell division protein FtsZ
LDPVTSSRVVSAPVVPATPAADAAKEPVLQSETVSVGAAVPDSSYDSAFGDDDLDIPDFLK